MRLYKRDNTVITKGAFIAEAVIKITLFVLAGWCLYDLSANGI